MNLISALEISLKLGLSDREVFEAVLSGEFLVSKGRDVKKDISYTCLIDMNNRKITILGEHLVG